MIPAALVVLLGALGGCRSKPLPEPVDLVLPRAETGQPFSFASRRGDVVIVYFFTTWCIPCQAMDPSVAEAARIGAREGIEVVGVALDREGRRTVAPYVAATMPPYPVVVGGGSVAEGQSPFGRIPELPATLFLDRDGRPAASISGAASSKLLLERARDVKSR
ncbi:TlpA disulfide reductase family protein [Vulgatibacter incomptus]|uniref:TlpA disulfide reductase family protein n=1 Tax=Vulgatibacter incomptus TaxID=1391653 RepID=UPI00146FCCC9|nr:TlpA disulfide reductase family protein [Vulgatibacter incomptus]